MSTIDTNRKLPAWGETLREKYMAGEASIFVLHGNVFDNVVVDGEDPRLVQEFLRERLLASKGIVLELGWSQGLRVVGGTVLEAAKSADNLPPDTRVEMKASDLAGGGLGDALRKVERIFRRQSSALVVPYAGTILPAGDPSLLSNDERAAFTTIHRWSIDTTLKGKDCLVVLLAQSLQEINQDILSSPRVATIEIGLPTEQERALVVRRATSKLSDHEVDLLAAHTSGLRAIQVETIVATPKADALDEDARKALIARLLEGKPNAGERAQKLAAITAGKTESEIVELVDPEASASTADSGHEEMLRVVHARKREIIEKECAGLISFMESRHGLEAVGGNEKLVAELMEIARLIKSGDRRLAPMGLLCTGPMGAGKTFVVRALLREAGLPGVALKNIRSKWNGATEANLERVLATVKAMGPIAVVIDESDRSFGSKDAADTDGGVSARVMARLKEFMSDTENRGQVLFILMTNRPDRIETDLKRPGRLDRKVPFFYCETAAERRDVLRAILARGGEAGCVDWDKALEVCEQMKGYSNADIEAVAQLAMEFAARRGVSVDVDLVAEAFDDFIPSREEDMIRLMELLAAQETSRRSLLPARFANMKTSELNAEVDRLRNKLRGA